MLKVGEEVLMLKTAYEKEFRPPAPDSRRTAAYRDTTIYFACPDVETTYKHLIAAGELLEPPSITGYGFRAVFVQDPDGFLLCFQWPIECVCVLGITFT